MLPSVHDLHGGQAYIFQQDNAPYHTARRVEEFFNRKNITVMKWLAQPPDMIIFENLWQVLKQKVRQKKPRNHYELWENILQA